MKSLLVPASIHLSFIVPLLHLRVSLDSLEGYTSTQGEADGGSHRDLLLLLPLHFFFDIVLRLFSRLSLLALLLLLLLYSSGARRLRESTRKERLL